MMTLIELMARSVGAKPQQNKNGDVEYLMDTEALERLASLVRADECEACAMVAEDADHVVGGRGYYDQLGDADATVRNIVAAIRARIKT